MVNIEIEKTLNNCKLNLDLLIQQHKNKQITNTEYKIKYDIELKILNKIKPYCKWQHKLSITILEIINKINKIILK